MMPGKPGTYRVILAKAGPYVDELAIDLGFSNYVRLAEVVEDVSPFKEGDILEFSDEQGEVRSLTAVHRTPYDLLYTYRAWVNRVLDGDTIEATIDIGFGFTTQQTLRLRAIDAPEIQTRDGMEAKEFVKKMLERPEGVRRTENGEKMDMKANAPVLIRAVKSDKYDRYLVDVYLNKHNIDNHLNF
ncbi:MAG: thermonuclease family protein [Candidatus Omnitrophota bacterium]|jgi:endonuclease YncB( thermonuclease family)